MRPRCLSPWWPPMWPPGVRWRRLAWSGSLKARCRPTTRLMMRCITSTVLTGLAPPRRPLGADTYERIACADGPRSYEFRGRQEDVLTEHLVLPVVLTGANPWGAAAGSRLGGADPEGAAGGRTWRHLTAHDQTGRPGITPGQTVTC